MLVYVLMQNQLHFLSHLKYPTQDWRVGIKACGLRSDPVCISLDKAEIYHIRPASVTSMLANQCNAIGAMCFFARTYRMRLEHHAEQLQLSKNNRN